MNLLVFKRQPRNEKGGSAPHRLDSSSGLTSMTGYFGRAEQRDSRVGRPGHGITPSEYQTASLTCGWKGKSMSALDAPPEAEWGWWRSRQSEAKRTTGSLHSAASPRAAQLWTPAVRKAGDVPWRVYLKNNDQDLNLILWIIFQMGTEVRVNATSTCLETSDIWQNSSVSDKCGCILMSLQYERCARLQLFWEGKVITWCLK